MSKITIENYRGFDIEFDTDCAKFQCICTEENAKESTSFTSVKKFIDDYKKANQEFKPFEIEPSPEGYKNSKFTVIGMAKNGRFIVKDNNGLKSQLSDFDTNYYIVSFPENESLSKKLVELKEKETKIYKEIKEERKNIISKMCVS